MVALVALACYASTATDYFLQDDFGVVGLLSQKPATFFPHWFVIPWTEHIWGYTPDELRPFPAVSYQIASAFGAGSPVPDHLVNIALHALNGVLVFWIALEAAGLSVMAAMFAGLIFVVLPIDAESVAWITGRVDSMPACFYFASFLFFVRWRNSARAGMYSWSLGLFFLALFAKQNTITMAPAIILYDAVIAKRRVELSWRWLRPYVPFVLMTMGFLGLRYAVFHEAAREDVLTAQRVQEFLSDASRHLVRLVFGGPGMRAWTLRDTVYVAAAATALIGLARRLAADDRSRLWRAAVYFGIVWLGLGVAPILVSGYYSPRHMYLAALGWAVLLGVGAEILLSVTAPRKGAPYDVRSVVSYVGRPLTGRQAAVAMIALAILGAYATDLRGVVRDWHRRAAVSRAAVRDIEREALAAPQGSVILAGVGTDSWAFSIPHALRPPFTTTDLTQRVSVISDSSLHCCDASQWNQYTRDALRGWADNPAHPPAIAMSWDPRSARLSRISDREDRQVRTVMTELLETDNRATLDSAIRRFLQTFVAGR